MLYDYLSRFKSKDYIYIDFNNLKLKNYDFFDLIDEFIEQNNISTIALDNFIPTLKLPNCQNILISTNRYLAIETFETIELNPLVFKEFLLFDRHQHITVSFDFFFRYGNFASTIYENEFNKNNHLQAILSQSSKDDTQLQMLLSIYKNGSQVKSQRQIYNEIKKSSKISKDRFYLFFGELLKNRQIYQLSKHNFPYSAKKLYLYNHSFISSINIKNRFNHTFENMIFLELNQKFDDIFYSNKIEFYIPKENLIVLCRPFFSASNIFTEVLSFIQEQKIKKVIIVTINQQEQIYLDNILCQIIPFYKWAVS